MGYRAGRFGGRPAGPVVIRVPGEAILTAERDATLLPVTGGQIADRPQSTSLPVSVSSASGGISAATVRGTVSVTAQRAGVRHMLDWRVNQTARTSRLSDWAMRIRWRSRRPPHCLPIMASRQRLSTRASARRWIQTYWSRCVMATSRSSPLKTGSLKAAGARK